MSKEQELSSDQKVVQCLSKGMAWNIDEVKDETRLKKDMEADLDPDGSIDLIDLAFRFSKAFNTTVTPQEILEAALDGDITVASLKSLFSKRFQGTTK